VANGISARDSWNVGSQWRRSEDTGVVMKEQRRGEQRGREGGLRICVAATGDKDRAVRRMDYAWRPGGQVAGAVWRELPLGGGCSRDRRSVRTRAMCDQLERFDCSTGPGPIRCTMFFQLFKNFSNFVIQVCCLLEFQKCSNFAK
jgi:hypothetical protein